MDEQLVVPDSITHEAVAEVRWTFLTKFSFRFFALFAFLLLFPFPLNMLPLISEAFSFVDELWYPIIQWVGDTVLQLPYSITVLPNGSGDTTYNYVQVFIIVSVSIIGAIFWSVFDYKRPSYKQLYKWLYFIVMIYVSYMMITYGLMKVVKLQFPYPPYSRLLQHLGDFSPMGLAWTFLGHSSTYNLYMGIGETLAGVLLLWRRTSFLGSILTMTIMSNVVMMNFSYDIPVKLFSSELFLLAFFLFLKGAIPFAKELFRRENSIEFITLKGSPTWRKILVKSVVIGLPLLVVCMNTIGLFQQIKMADEMWSSPLEGLYSVDTFTSSNDSTDESVKEWEYFMVDKFSTAVIQYRNLDKEAFHVTIDTSSRLIWLQKKGHEDFQYKFTYRKEMGEMVYLEGVSNDDSLHISLVSTDSSIFQLTSRGFHWINEYPFNR